MREHPESNTSKRWVFAQQRELRLCNIREEKYPCVKKGFLPE